MKIYRKIHILILVAFTETGMATGFTAFGINDLTCGKYLSEINSNPQALDAYDWWLSGFITGVNLEKGRLISTDVPAHNAWIKNFCEENPLLPFGKAAIELNNTLDDLAK